MLKILTTATVYLVLAAVWGFQADEAKPIVSEDLLTAEQVAIYRAALADFRPTPGETPQLANITVPLRRQRTAFEKCVAGIREPLEHDPHPSVHRLNSFVVAGMDLPLVDPWEVPQRRLPNAPHLGLLSLSEIAFDTEHLHAVVVYDFNCGGLCGHKKVLALTKSGEEWKVSKFCGGWLY